MTSTDDPLQRSKSGFILQHGPSIADVELELNLSFFKHAKAFGQGIHDALL
jgi:hypothetical protein